jgi:hypothetical protein
MVHSPRASTALRNWQAYGLARSSPVNWPVCIALEHEDAHPCREYDGAIMSPLLVETSCSQLPLSHRSTTAFQTRIGTNNDETTFNISCRAALRPPFAPPYCTSAGPLPSMCIIDCLNQKEWMMALEKRQYPSITEEVQDCELWLATVP